MAYKTIEQAREYQRRWRAANPEKTAEYHRRRIAANPERERRLAREYRTRHLQEERVRSHEYYMVHRKEHAEKTNKWRKEHPEKAKEYRRKHELKKNYGLTPEMYDSLLKKQGGACAICGGGPGKKGFSVDHLHKEGGSVRGILCGLCNASLGGFRDSPALLRKAAEYLEKSCAE